MNKVELIGRLTKDPEVRYGEIPAEDGNTNVSARFTLAVRRNSKGDADFIRCIAFDKAAHNVERYLVRGSRVGLIGKIHTGSYTNKDGKRVYTTDVVVLELYFLDDRSTQQDPIAPEGEDFLIPDIPDDASLPFR
ncbi:single-stranded DNA-binding protein [Cuneatibacter caecimuris]|uniref:Single-stranded DNA-binding protein n=1 Tax=Cuneatibacter caecimuris TaxID=1796618 RepID=A0A4Q7PPW0_9FIRM|nr:single-stranded DNA-binding protein [Cuneatibacter caecimuris]RZT01202.1 single-strand DNA-binding protein [Cuneatibacter caecimuris]